LGLWHHKQGWISFPALSSSTCGIALFKSGLTRSRTGAGPIASGAVLAGGAVELVRGVFPLEKGVRLLGVAVSGFEAGQRDAEHQIAFDFGRPG
jgi:hypothetical protein